MAEALSAHDILAKLVSFDTTSRNSNLALIHWVRDYLAAFGVESRLIPDETGNKANLLASIGPPDKPGVVLSGHTDVVPVDGQDWLTDPWTLTEKHGALYGRGTSDMKSFAAVCLAQLPGFLDAPLNAPVHFAFSYDEETGCFGAGPLADAVAELPARPFVCIVGEPSGMQVVTGQKAGYAFVAEFHGYAAHSSLAPQGVNAVEYACKLVDFLTALREEYAVTGPFADGYDVPYNTVHTGVLAGGTALNIVPEYCRVEFEYRLLPDYDEAALRTRVLDFVRNELEFEMQRISPAARIDVDVWPPIPGYDLAPDADAVQFVRAIAGRNDDTKVSYQTEAGIFSARAGVPSVICGPGFIAQAHKPNEFIGLEQLEAGERFIERLIARLRR